MIIKHSGYIDQQVLKDLRAKKKVGSYIVYLEETDYVRGHEGFINVPITLNWHIPYKKAEKKVLDKSQQIDVS